MAHHSWWDRQWITNYFICQITSCACLIYFWQVLNSQLFWFLTKVSQHRHLPTDPKYKRVLYQQSTGFFQELAVHPSRLIYLNRSTVEKLWRLSLAFAYEKNAFWVWYPRSWTQHAPSLKHHKPNCCTSLVFTSPQELPLSCRTKQLRFATSCPAFLCLSLINLLRILWRKGRWEGPRHECWYRVFEVASLFQEERKEKIARTRPLLGKESCSFAGTPISHVSSSCKSNCLLPLWPEILHTALCLQTQPFTSELKFCDLQPPSRQLKFRWNKFTRLQTSLSKDCPISVPNALVRPRCSHDSESCPLAQDAKPTCPSRRPPWTSMAVCGGRAHSTQ